MHVIKVLKQFLAKFKPPQPYADSTTLIERAIERHMEKAKITPFCPFCRSQMKFRFSNLSRYGWPLREDQCWKCPYCYFTATFGIPLTRQEWQTEYNLRKGHILMRPDLREDEKHKKEVIARLKALGYLDF